MDIVFKKLQTVVLVASCCLSSATVMAAGEVRQVGTSFVPATPFRYTADGLTHTWGSGENQLIESFSTDDDTFRFASVADRVELVRDDISAVSTGVPCGVFGERAGPSASLLAPDFPNDIAGTGNCDMALMLASRVVNRGALDLFSNIGPNPKNVERVDYLFDAGVIASFSTTALYQTGHLVAEKRGNNRIQVAAILALDAFGQPAEYGPLIRIHEFFDGDESNVRYGETNLRHNYSFFQSNSLTPQAFPVFLKDTTETVAMAFVSARRLGLGAGQTYYGFSYFGDDVDPGIHALTDVTTFPDTTADNDIVPGDGADIYGGVSGFFVSDNVSVGSGAVFIDENGDGLQDINEAGISGVEISLFSDTNNNGMLDLGVDDEQGSVNSSVSGGFVLPGLSNGQFLLVVNEADPDLPGGTQVPSNSVPLLFVVDNNDPENLNFALIDSNFDDGASGDGDGSVAGAGDASGDAGGSAGADGADADAGGDAGADGDGSGAGAGDADVDAGGDADAGGDLGAGGSGFDAEGVTDDDASPNIDPDDINATGGPDGNVDTDDGNNNGDDAGSGGDGVTDTDGGAGTGDGADSGSGDGTDSGGDAGSGDGADSDGDAGSGDGADGTDTDNGDNGDGESTPGIMTDAVPDVAQVDQGATVVIDVLANDIDGPGLGLTVLSVSESPNATITLENGLITYTPNFSFFGTDSFSYTVVDGNGVESSATVSVEVIRFSDINDNGINDFVECNCTSLQLETGVHGVGLGGGGAHWSLLLFLGLFGLIRRSIHIVRQRTRRSA